MNTTRTHKKRFPTYLLAAALGGAVAGPVLLAAPAARAAEEEWKQVSAERVPPAARVILENEAGGSHELRFFIVRPHEFAVRYTKPYHLRLETRVDEAGRVVGRSETTGQPELKGRHELEEARAIAAREEAERQAAAEAAVRAQAEHEARERLRAEKIAERDAYYQQHLADLERLEADARRQRAEAAADARRMSEEWNADRIFPAWRDRLPEDVRRTLDQETLGTTEIRYYQYIVGDQTYFSAHFTLAGGRRTEARVDPAGHLLGKRDLTPAEEDRFLGREKWFHDQWGQHAVERPVERPAEHVEHGPVVVSGKSVRINPEEAPAAVREAVRREARGERALEFYRVDVPGRNNDQYIVGYTDDANRRIHVQLTTDGAVLERRELIEGHERPLR